MSDQTRRAAIVTGAAGGIGSAITHRLAKDGVDVLAVDLDLSATQFASGADGVAFAADLTTRTGNANAVRAALDEFGRLDMIIANAGFQHVSPIADFAEDRWDSMLSLMLTSPFLLAKYGWPSLVSAPEGGRFLVVASAHALVASPFKAGYVAAKHGVLGLVKTLALEGAEHDLCATAICPAYVRTPLVEKQVAAQATAHGLTEDRVLQEVILAAQPVKRLIEPEEVAGDLAAFLLGPYGRSFTGVPVSIGPRMDHLMGTTTCPPGISNAALESAFGVYQAVLRGGTDYFAGALARRAGPADLCIDVLDWLKASTTRTPPRWATEHTVVAEWPIARLRDFSVAGPPEAIPTLFLPPQAGHDSCIVDFDPHQSQVRTALEAGLTRVLSLDWVGATESTKDATVEDYIAVMVAAVGQVGGRVNLVGDCQGGWLAVIYAALHPDTVETLTIAGAPVDFHAGEPLIHDWMRLLAPSATWLSTAASSLQRRSASGHVPARRLHHHAAGQRAGAPAPAAGTPPRSRPRRPVRGLRGLVQAHPADTRRLLPVDRRAPLREQRADRRHSSRG